MQVRQRWSFTVPPKWNSSRPLGVYVVTNKDIEPRRVPGESLVPKTWNFHHICQVDREISWLHADKTWGECTVSIPLGSSGEVGGTQTAQRLGAGLHGLDVTLQEHDPRALSAEGSFYHSRYHASSKCFQQEPETHSLCALWVHDHSTLTAAALTSQQSSPR